MRNRMMTWPFVGVWLLIGGLGTTRASIAAQRAPLPQALVAAKTVYLVNDSNDVKAFDAFYARLLKWRRLTVVTSRDQADLVAVLTANAAYAGSVAIGSTNRVGGTTTNVTTEVAGTSTQLVLKIFENGTGEQLWSDATEKWATASHAPNKLVDRLSDRLPRR